MVVGVRDRLRDGALGHGPREEVPVDVVYANGDRSVPVGYGGYFSVSGVGIRRDFRKVVDEASRFAGSSSRADQADEKVTVIVLVCQSASYGYSIFITGIVSSTFIDSASSLF